jgi:transcriptional regulator with XRE-family HTH domain
MISVNEIIAFNLKRVRQERNLTQDALSRLTGVSRSMLCSIERREKSPTVAVLERLCNGINISLSELTYTPTPEMSVRTRANIKHYGAWEGFEAFSLFEYDPDRRFEIFWQVVQAHSERSSEAHEAGVREYIICARGVFGVQVGEVTLQLQAGEAVQFLANYRHRYFNASDHEAAYLMILYHE